MLIDLKNTSQQELYLIECQASIDIQYCGAAGKLPFGELLFRDKTPILYIGNHIIEGSVVELSHPLLVTEKAQDTFQIKSVVRSKLIFRTRPQIVVKT